MCGLDEPFGLIKGWTFLDYLSDVASQERFSSSVELII
jgi:hypothetical protein